MDAYHQARAPQRAAVLELRRDLNKWQIILLALSGIIGVTIFSTIGEILNTAAVAGLLIALLLVSATAVSVMTSLSELVVLWPIPNALVEYVKKFVDEDLAIVVGLAYWYTWSSIFSVLLITAYDFFCNFLHNQTYRVIIFVIAGFVLVAINMAGVKTYGRIEALGGALKWLMALAGGLFLWVAVGKNDSPDSQPAFGYQKWQADNAFTAICMSMPILAYGFLGVEIVAVTAFEAQDRETLRDPSRFIAWFMSATYFFCALPGAIVVSWTDPDLQRLVPEPETSDKRSLPGDGDTFDECQKFYPLIVVAALQYSSKALAGYFNACIVYFCLSAANTSLYVASRTLYGLMREETQYVSSGSIVQKLLQSPRVLGRISPRTGVPVWALVVSAASFAWLPVLRAANDGSGTDTPLSVMTTIGSVGGVLVWAAQCLAYIKYYSWLRRYQHTIANHYDRSANEFVWQTKRPWLSSLQPAIAWFGLFMCLLIVFVLGTAIWWDQRATAARVAAVYAGPACLIGVFIALKIWRFFLGDPKVPPEESELGNILERLSGLPLGNARRVSDDAGGGKRRRFGILSSSPQGGSTSQDAISNDDGTQLRAMNTSSSTAYA